MLNLVFNKLDTDSDEILTIDNLRAYTNKKTIDDGILYYNNIEFKIQQTLADYKL